MAASLPLPLLLLLLTLISLPPPSLQQPPLDPSEQESLYLTLESLNPTLPWRTLFPASSDLCLSPPHGILCDLFPLNDTASSSHIVELNFGPISPSSPNPPCSQTSSFPPPLLLPSSFPRLRKLLFYNCFTLSPTPFPHFPPNPHLTELVLIGNSALSGPLSPSIAGFYNLRRLIVTGSKISGTIPAEIARLSVLEELTLSWNDMGGEVPSGVGDLRSVRVLDLSHNRFGGVIPASIGGLGNLVKMDLGFNLFEGRVPGSFEGLKGLEFLDLSYNRLGGYGVPLFLGEMVGLKEVYLSGNELGGAIPEIWGKLGGVLGIGLSGLGLVGNIPASMGVFLGSVVYIGLDNNSLDGSVPREFGRLERVCEVNLENNRLSGRVPLSQGFVSRLGGKLRLQGNAGLCADKEVLLNGVEACKDVDHMSFSVPVGNGAGVSSSSSFKVVMSWFLWVFGHLVCVML